MVEPHEKRNVLLGVTGSIAAYKSPEIVRILLSRGFKVRVVMTNSAKKFIAPLTFEALTGNPVVSDMWEDTGIGGIEHISLANWADVLLIAPATADIMAKLAHGGADSALLTMALASKAPLLLAPAMNVNMLNHTQTQANMMALKERGVVFIDPEEGELACGMVGGGRLADPWEIFHQVRRACSFGDFKDRRVLISTGPTREMLDPVRFVSNRSSGKMGMALAREAYRRGAEVTLIHGPVPVRVPRPVRCRYVLSAQDMQLAVMAETFEAERPPDVVIMAAAVADFRPKVVSQDKLKKGQEPPQIVFENNPDILTELGRRRGTEVSPVLVGFAVETGDIDFLISQARDKLKNKKADMIVGNFAEDALELDTNRVWLVDRAGRQDEVSTAYKGRVANKILDSVVRLL